jgi:hypothetical protein
MKGNSEDVAISSPRSHPHPYAIGRGFTTTYSERPNRMLLALLGG